jgi:hypothetical protein
MSRNNKHAYFHIHRNACEDHLVPVIERPLLGLHRSRRVLLLPLSALQFRLTTLEFSLSVCMEMCMFAYMHREGTQMCMHMCTLSLCTCARWVSIHPQSLFCMYHSTFHSISLNLLTYLCTYIQIYLILHAFIHTHMYTERMRTCSAAPVPS